MKKNRIIACIMIFTMMLTSGLGNVGLLLSSYAQDKSDLIISDIFNEEPKSTSDGKLILDQNIEKISDTELKINLKIKNLSENTDLKNVSIVNTLSDNLEIKSDSVSVLGIENTQNIKGEVTPPRDTMTISLGDISLKELNISFLAKIRISASAMESGPLNIKSEFKYTLENNEEYVYKFPIPKLTLSKRIVENIEYVPKNDGDTSQENIKDEMTNEKLPQVENVSSFVEGLESDANKNPVSSKSLQTNKKAESNGDDTFKITLEVKGTTTMTEPKKADIVMVIDSSGSMSDKGEEVKTAAKNFSKNILDSSTAGQVEISVLEFSCRDKYTSGGSSSEVTPFTSNIEDINKGIDGISWGGGTDTEDGIRRVSNSLYYQSTRKPDRQDANKYVVFFTDGLPNESYSGYVTGHDQAFKDAQTTYYDYFTGYGSPTQVTIGGIGYHESGTPIPETISVNNQPLYEDAKFYSLGLFVNPREGEREQSIKFLQTIQNVIEPSQYADKYYTEDLHAINDVFMDISRDIKAEINSTIAKDVVIHDIVTKEFNIVDGSWKITDLNGNSIPILPENVIVKKTADGCDDITIKVGDILLSSGSLEGGVRVSFDVATADPYFSGENIKTNVGADLIYKDPATNTESSQKFLEDPIVNVARKTGTIKVTKNVKNSSGVIMPDDTPFEIVIERVGGANDPQNIIKYNKTYKLKSKEFGRTGIKHLIGPNTVSADGKLVLSTDVVNKDNYLIAGDYIVKEINIPENYSMAGIKINGSVVSNTPSLLEKFESLFSKNASLNQTTFTLSKDKPSIDIEVINKSTLTNNLIKNKTATPVVVDGKPTGEYEIALKVSTPKVDYITWMYDNTNIKYINYASPEWATKTVNNSRYKSTSSNGNYFEFEFEGTGFEWIAQGATGEYLDEAQITIDGVTEYSGKKTYSSTDGEKVIFSKKNLSFGKHCVTIQHWNKDSSIKNILSVRKVLIYTGSSTNDIISNTTITDVVSEYFDIVKDGYGTGKTAKIEKSSGSTPIDISTTIGTKVINGKTYDSLTWKPINIDSNGVTIKFKVQPKDLYYASDGIYTNAEATIEYLKGNVINKEYFNKPTVNIGINGKISIKKDVTNKENATEVFNIKISGGKNNEVYNIDIKDGETKNLDVILKDTNSIIQKPGQQLTIGQYKVDEVSIPDGYECLNIRIGNKVYPLGKDAVFTIDKNNPNITIEVENKILPKVDKTVAKIEDGIYEMNLIVKSNGINANDVRVSDTVADEFIIASNQYNTDGTPNPNGQITSVVTNLVNCNLMMLPSGQPTINGNTISWNVGSVPPEGISIKFRIKVKDDYFGGSKINTNKEAHLEYTDTDGGKKNILFPVPNVDISYKKGSITIRKEIVAKREGNQGIWETIPNNKVNKNDTFSISLVGNQTYTVDLKGNSQSKMLFYLKGSNTSISNNTDFSLNYFTEGLYSIKEIVPMNYEQVEVYIDQTPNGNSPTWVTFDSYVNNKSNIDSNKVKDGKIFIGKNNTDISIKVTNTVVNNRYYQDKSSALNKFKFGLNNIKFKKII